MNEETPKNDVEIEQVIDDIQEEVKQAEKKEAEDMTKVNEEIKNLKEEVMRLRADAVNVRKRNNRDLENLRKFAIDKFSKALLPVADSMDKELEAFDKAGVEMTTDQMIEGTKMTQNVLNKVLKENGMEIINPIGEKFNPEFHEAMAQIPNPDLEPNTVVDVFQKGYILNGRLVRPAMVVVSK
jgi:molecular chaperone GrpE